MNKDSATGIAMPPVRFDGALLEADLASQVDAFDRCIAGFARRLSAADRAKFLMALDSALYQQHGRAAIDAEGGLHPKHRLMRYHDFFCERIAPGSRVIDLGSGVAALACSIAERCGAAVTGIELSPQTMEKARARVNAAGLGGRITLHAGDITTLRIPVEFDVVVLSNVLEHVTHRPQRLRTWAQWYSPGKFLIRVPALDREWRAPWKKELGVEWRLDDTHETEYTRDQLARELAEAGLAIRELTAVWGEYWVVASPEGSGA